MKLSTLKCLRNVFFLTLLSCLVWVVFAVLFFHNFSLSKSIRTLNKARLLPPFTLPRKLAMFLPALGNIDEQLARPFRAATFSEINFVGKYIQYKHLSHPQNGSQSRLAGDKTANHSHLSKNKHGLYNFSENVINAVSMMKVIRAEEYLRQSFFTPRDRVVNTFHTKWLIKTTCPVQELFLLIIVPSVGSHKVHRTAIRETWGSLAYGHAWPGTSKPWNDSVKLVFFLGISRQYYSHEELLSEAEDFHDIVVGDFMDSYQNLSLKMATALQWVDLFCASTQHVLKVDEDTFVNLPLLLGVLRLFSETQTHFVMGHKRPSRKLQVSHWGRWKVDRNVYPLEYYPQYLYGHSYVISGDAISSLRHASCHLPLISNEDIYVTGVLAKSARVSRVHNWRFAIVGRRSMKCSLVNNTHISQTGFSASGLHEMWNEFRTGNCIKHH